MNEINVYEVVKKLIGNINPIGNTQVDDKRFENLKNMLSLVDKIHADLCEVEYQNKNSPEFSRKRASELASKFLDTLKEV